MFKEFKEFALKGNVIDLAVGIVIGTAFTAIVNSLVKDIITPSFGALMGGLDFKDRFLVLKAGANGLRHFATLADATAAGAVTVNFGLFLNAIIQFVILAFSMFILIQNLQRLKRPAPTPAVTTKDCPKCALAIPLAATRCPHCTSELAS